MGVCSVIAKSPAYQLTAERLSPTRQTRFDRPRWASQHLCDPLDVQLFEIEQRQDSLVLWVQGQQRLLGCLSVELAPPIHTRCCL